MSKLKDASALEEWLWNGRGTVPNEGLLFNAIEGLIFK